MGPKLYVHRAFALAESERGGCNARTPSHRGAQDVQVPQKLCHHLSAPPAHPRPRGGSVPPPPPSVDLDPRPLGACRCREMYEYCSRPCLPAPPAGLPDAPLRGRLPCVLSAAPLQRRRGPGRRAHGKPARRARGAVGVRSKSPAFQLQGCQFALPRANACAACVACADASRARAGRADRILQPGPCASRARAFRGWDPTPLTAPCGQARRAQAAERWASEPRLPRRWREDETRLHAQ